MFIGRERSKRSPRSNGAKRKLVSRTIAGNIALRWSASRAICSWVYKHSAPTEPACCLIAALYSLWSIESSSGLLSKGFDNTTIHEITRTNTNSSSCLFVKFRGSLFLLVAANIAARSKSHRGTCRSGAKRIRRACVPR